MTSTLLRTSCQGLAQIFRYNRPFYLCTLAASLTAIFVSVHVLPALRILILLPTAMALFWTCSSLLVSHYVYDRSGLYQLLWLRPCLSHPPSRWIQIHAGIDETSPAIRSLFPGSEEQTLDIYDPCKMTEPSIKRARRLAGVASPPYPQALPAQYDYFDTAFLIFAAHELRRHEDRVELFRKVTRLLRKGGELVLVEHLRNWPNFLAYGPGFLHFFSNSTWLKAANAAGFLMRIHRTRTPFVHILVFQKVR